MVAPPPGGAAAEPDWEAAPEWLRQVVSAPVERTMTTVEGAQIETLAWGSRGAPGVLLMHGYASSADWWVYVAPLIARGRRVVALSYSGMGRSDWRESYTIGLYAREALACGRAAGAFDGGPAAVIAHSFGATFGVRVAVELGQGAGGFIVLDRPIEQNQKLGIQQKPPSAAQLFPTAEAALERFKPRPAIVDAEPALVSHLARQSIRRMTDAPDSPWTWRPDPDLHSKLTDRDNSLAAHLAAMSCPRIFVRGARSALFTEEDAEAMRAAGERVIALPAAGHHLLLEQPVATAAVLEACLVLAMSPR
jgi:pimeloyl-ACP methyl ester carboxylesterase